MYRYSKLHVYVVIYIFSSLFSMVCFPWLKVAVPPEPGAVSHYSLRGCRCKAQAGPFLGGYPCPCLFFTSLSPILLPPPEAERGGSFSLCQLWRSSCLRGCEHPEWADHPLHASHEQLWDLQRGPGCHRGHEKPLVLLLGTRRHGR